MLLSVVIPAHNEEQYIQKAISSIYNAADICCSEVEIIVVANRCSDATEEIAKSNGCTVVVDSHRNISKTKNAGVQVARGEILVTMDADSIMHKQFLVLVEKTWRSGKVIGGQAPIRYDRSSPGIALLTALINSHLLLKGYTGGFYWCSRETFLRLGGFDESLRFCEDIDFAKRLRSFGKKHKKKYAIQHKTPFISSSRKFDSFGDWHYLRSMFWGFLGKSEKMIKGIDNFEDGYFYSYQDEQ